MWMPVDTQSAALDGLARQQQATLCYAAADMYSQQRFVPCRTMRGC